MGRVCSRCTASLLNTPTPSTLPPRSYTHHCLYYCLLQSSMLSVEPSHFVRSEETADGSNFQKHPEIGLNSAPVSLLILSELFNSCCCGYLAVGRGAKCCDEYCLSVRLFVCLHNSKTTRPSFTKRMLPVARSSSDGVAIRCLFPVLWMTSHTPVLYRNGYADRADRLRICFPRPCVLGKLGYLQRIRALPSRPLPQTLDLENFPTARRPSASAI